MFHSHLSPHISTQVVVEQAQAEALAAAAAAGDSLICQAIINSGIALGREEAIVEESSQSAEDTDRGDSDCPQADEGFTEIHVKEELLEVEMETEVRTTFSRRFLLTFPSSVLFARSFKPVHFSVSIRSGIDFLLFISSYRLHCAYY